MNKRGSYMIVLENVNKNIGKKIILENINCQIDSKNGVVGFVGKNGSGKTTLLKIISGIYEINSGRIAYKDKLSKDYMKWAHRNVVYISSDERNLFYKNSVQDNVQYFCMLKGADREHALHNIDIYFKLFHFDDLKNKRVEELSTGQKKIVKILCALCTDCHFILLDEPTLGLDKEHTSMFYEILKQEGKERKIIIVSHDEDFLSHVVSGYMEFDRQNNCIVKQYTNE